MQVKVKKLHKEAKLPTYATEGSACFDLYATEGNRADIAPAVVGTGLAFEIPKGHALLLFSRSGHGFTQDVRLANCVGVIDSDYRGEVKVKLTNDNKFYKAFYIKEGDRIAQGMIIPVPAVEFVEGELSDTARGDGGFGSTG